MAFPGLKRGIAVPVRKGILHNHVVLPPLALIEATGICILIGHREVLLSNVHKPLGQALSDPDIIGILEFRNKSLLAGDLNAKNLFGTVKFQILQVRKYWTYLIITTFKFQRHSNALTIRSKEVVMYLILWSILMSNWQMSLFLTCNPFPHTGSR
jgi:hypothetical protein